MLSVVGDGGLGRFGNGIITSAGLVDPNLARHEQNRATRHLRCREIPPHFVDSLGNASSGCRDRFLAGNAKALTRFSSRTGKSSNAQPLATGDFPAWDVPAIVGNVVETCSAAPRAAV
jgi:hypothetical protein